MSTTNTPAKTLTLTDKSKGHLIRQVQRWIEVHATETLESTIRGYPKLVRLTLEDETYTLELSHFDGFGYQHITALDVEDDVPLTAVLKHRVKTSPESYGLPYYSDPVSVVSSYDVKIYAEDLDLASPDENHVYIWSEYLGLVDDPPTDATASGWVTSDPVDPVFYGDADKEDDVYCFDYYEHAQQWANEHECNVREYFICSTRDLISNK